MLGEEPECLCRIRVGRAEPSECLLLGCRWHDQLVALPDALLHDVAPPSSATGLIRVLHYTEKSNGTELTNNANNPNDYVLNWKI